MQKEIKDALANYGFTEGDVIEMVTWSEIIEKGYGWPVDKGVHSLHFPESAGNYYILKCIGKENGCTLCNY